MLIARGHSNINTTLSVIMSLFCCRFLCLCISLSRCLCLFSLALTLCTCRLSSLKFCRLLLLLTHWRSSSLALRVLTLALCRSPSFYSLLKTCRLHAKISLLLFVDRIAFVSYNKKVLSKNIFAKLLWNFFFQNHLHDIIARRCAMRFPAKKSLLSPTPTVRADYFPLPGKSVRTNVRWRHN